MGEMKEEGRFPKLCKMALAVLTCFHGPQVESAFSTMGDILDTKSSRTNVETFSLVMSVKYHLKANDKSAVQYYRKADFLHEQVQPKLVNHMTSANRRYKAEVKQARGARDTKREELKLKSKKLATKQRIKDISENLAKKAHLMQAKKC